MKKYFAKLMLLPALAALVAGLGCKSSGANLPPTAGVNLAAIGATNGVIRDLSASEAVSDSDFQDASKAVYDAIEQNTGYRLVVHLVLDAVIIVSMLWWMGSRRHASSRAVSTAQSTSRNR